MLDVGHADTLPGYAAVADTEVAVVESPMRVKLGVGFDGGIMIVTAEVATFPIVITEVAVSTKAILMALPPHP